MGRSIVSRVQPGDRCSEVMVVSVGEIGIEGSFTSHPSDERPLVREVSRLEIGGSKPKPPVRLAAAWPHILASPLASPDG